MRQRNELDILYRRIKDIALKHSHRSKEFISFVKQNSKKANCQFHHAFGSMGKLKSTDLLGVAVDPHEHMKAEREWILEQIPEAIENLLLYTIELENKERKR